MFVVMELAGVAIDRIEVRLKDRVLTVRGERPDYVRKKKCEFQQMEIDYGRFERRLRISTSVAGHLASAHYSNGFLVIELPKEASTEDQKEMTIGEDVTIVIIDH